MAEIRVAVDADLPRIAQMLFELKTELGEITPSVKMLVLRLALLVHETDTTILIIGDEPAGVAVLRFRRALWTAGKEGFLTDLHVVPERKDQGLGSELVAFAIEYAKTKNADTFDLGKYRAKA